MLLHNQEEENEEETDEDLFIEDQHERDSASLSPERACKFQLNMDV